MGETLLGEVNDDSNSIGSGLLPSGIERSSCGTAVRIDTYAMSTDDLPVRHVTVPVVVLRGLKIALNEFNKLTAFCVAAVRERILCADQAIKRAERECITLQEQTRGPSDWRLDLLEQHAAE